VSIREPRLIPHLLLGLLVPVAFAIPGIAVGQSCGAMSGDSTVQVAGAAWPAPLDRRITLHARGISLREALDRAAAESGIRLSYSAELIPLDRVECLSYDGAPVGDVLVMLLAGTSVAPVVASERQVALAPAQPRATEPTMASKTGMLDRVVVTGSATGAPQRSLTVALDVLDGRQLVANNASSLSEAFDGAVPGVWAWGQSPVNLLTSYASIRGASSFGLSYPKVYIDGIQVANPLLLNRFYPAAIDRIEVIRGPQGAALYGADAISGVVNIVTRNEGTDPDGAHVGLNGAAGVTQSDFSPHGSLTQEHAATFNAGTSTQSADANLSVGTMGAFIPNAYTRSILGGGNGRIVASHAILTGVIRVFAEEAGSPTSPLLMHETPASPAGVLDTDAYRVAPRDSSPQSVREYTVGGSATILQSGRWTHSVVVGVDGYRLSNVASDQTPLDGVDSALHAAQGGADRGSIRASSVAQFGNASGTSGTLTIAAEHSALREATSGSNSFGAGKRYPAAIDTAQVVTWEHNTGVTAQTSVSVENAAFLTGGLRLERNTGFTSGTQWSLLPMLGAAAVEEEGPFTFKLRGAYGKGIRPAQTSTRATTRQPYAPGVTQTNLSPESQSGVEAGFDMAYRNRLSLQVTRYDQRASGLIQEVGVATAATAEGGQREIAYTLQNVGEITNRGWEAEGSAQFSRLTIGSTYSMVDSRVAKLTPGYTGDLRAGDRMLQVPTHTVGLRAAWTADHWSTSLTGSRAWDWINYDRLALAATYLDQSHPVDDMVGPQLRAFWRTYDGATRLRLAASRDVRSGMALELTIDNLLNYQRGEPDNATVLPGRTILTGLRLRF
jgi:iron complex outermembrane recepter protein